MTTILYKTRDMNLRRSLYNSLDQRQIVETICSLAQAEIAEYWAATLSKAEDVFCLQARKAVTNTEQNICFESMRELQFKHSILMKGFADALECAFLEIVMVRKTDIDARVAGPAQHGATHIEREAASEAAVVADVVEVYAPISKENLAKFSSCLERMLIKKYAQVPISPLTLCRVVQSTLELVSIPSEKRQTILTIFAEVVLGHLPEIVENLVTVLEQQGLSSDRSSKASELFNREAVG